MKKMYNLLMALTLLFAVNTAQAQTRYLNEVFTSVDVDTDVVYGVNSTVLFASINGQVVEQPLYMDVYRPEGDTANSRPLVIYMHTGSFLPFSTPLAPFFANGSCGGTKRDSAAVEICTRLAKMGYVVASISYRLGWNPVSTSEIVRRATLINAAYRGVQDSRNAIRYFRKQTAVDGNPWGIDSTKVVLWGQGTGGYISLAASGLDAYVKIPTSSDNKFMVEATPGVLVPMVIESVNGNINGTSYGAGPGLIPQIELDTFCVPNYVGYGSGFSLAVNMAGAIGDSSWMDPGQVPIISFQTTTDIYAPYTEDILVVPTTDENVVKVQGAYVIGKLGDDFGNNDVFNTPFFDQFGSNQAASFAASPTSPEDLTSPLSAVYPFNVSADSITAPWEWTFSSATGCNTNKAIAIPYIDTIMGFYAPRGCLALGLTDCVAKLVGAKDQLSKAQVGLAVAPNPASDMATVSVNAAYKINHLRVIDINGRLVASQLDVNNNTARVYRNDLPTGTYFVQLILDQGQITTTIMFN